jgi:uncharacterized protein YigA (DUF484 family)
MNKSVMPIEREINNLKRQADDLAWEGRNNDHVCREIERLVQDMLDGEKWYVNF